MLSDIFNMTHSDSLVSLSKELSSCSIDRLVFHVSVDTPATDINSSVLENLKLNVYLKNGVSDGQDDVIVKNVQLSKLFVLSDFVKGTGGMASLKTENMYFDVLLGNIILSGDDRLTISITSDKSVSCTIKMWYEDATKGKEHILKYEQITSTSGQTHNLTDVAQIFTFGNSNSNITIKDYFGEKMTSIGAGQALAKIDGCIESELFADFGILYKDFTNAGIDVSVSGVDDISYLILSHAIHLERVKKMDKDTRNLTAYFEDLKAKQPQKFSFITAK